ncbi:hypothetical protein B0H21DRAFT_526913 [Amylocystis lapponica]|nr:hypothetical protein B0H21DRAFT_526913 [Amylocystis lapponica]
MTREEFTRLYKGPLADVLRFVAEHIKGRVSVASARDAIQQMREAGKGKGRSDVGKSSYDRAQAAAVRLSGARSSLESVQEALNDRQQSIADLQRKADKVQATLEDKRLDLLLLSVLEKKETLRGERFAQIAVLLARLREEVVAQNKTSQTHESSMPELSPPLWTPINAENTRDVLAMLHAHHVSLARLASRPDPGQKKSGENALQAAVASVMGLPEDDSKVVAACEKCLRLARIRAADNLRYRPPLDSSTPLSNVGLDTVLQRVMAKEQALQRLSDSSIAFGLSSAHSLQSMLNFSSVTVPELRASLKEQEAAAHGYVDVLRLSIANRERASERQDQSSAQDTLPWLNASKSWDRVLADVQNDLEQAHTKETFLRAVLPRGTDDSGADGDDTARETGALIDAYRNRQAKVDERITKLLTRKLEKAHVGDVLVKNIERLVAEVSVLGSLSSSSMLASSM